MDAKPTENFDELKKVYEKIDLPFQDKDTRKRQITEKIMAAKPTIRRITCNKDLIVLLICCLSCCFFGYALNTFISSFTDNNQSVNQVTTQVNQVNQIATQSNIKELVLLFFISFFSAVGKLVVNKGFISEKFSEKLTDVITKIGELWKEFFKKNESIDPETYITIIGDRKER